MAAKLHSSAWLGHHLRSLYTIKLQLHEINSSIYATERFPAIEFDWDRRIDMRSVEYSAGCKADTMFWAAALALYHTRLKFIPQTEAREFVEQCWHTHLCKPQASIAMNNRNVALEKGRENPTFADVVVLCLLYGHEEVRRRTWYSRWMASFNVNFKMPAKLEGLFRQQNLEPYKPGQSLIQSITLENTASSCSPDSEGPPRKHNDQRSDVDTQQSTSATLAVTPPPKVTNNVRRQSAVDSEKRTRQLYERYPALNEDAPQSPSPRDKSSHSTKKRPHSAMSLGKADDKVHPTGPRSAPRRRLNMQSNTGTWNLEQSISTSGLSLSPEAPSERRTPSTEELLARAEASSPRTPKVKQSESFISHKTTSQEQMILDSESEQDVETQNSSATLERDCTNTPVPQSMHASVPELSLEPASVMDTSDDMLKMVKDVLTEKQNLVMQVEAWKAEMTEKHAKKLQLERELSSMNTELEIMQAEITAAYRKLQTGLKLPLR